MLGMTDEIPQKVRDLAADIAGDIQRLGHYQGGGIVPGPHNDWKSGCCVFVCPSMYSAARTREYEEIKRLIGTSNAVYWNDRTPTDEVLATLRKIAAGERP